MSGDIVCRIIGGSRIMENHMDKKMEDEMETV